MITVSEAQQIILSTTISIPTQLVNIEAGLGTLLREDLVADRDFPPFNRVTMDGIAIRYTALEKGNTTFTIAGISPAGTPQATLEQEDHCLEVMTGCILPKGADTVIRYEDLDIKEGKAQVLIDSVKDGQNVHYQGEDRKKGDRIVSSGRFISPAEIGVAATIGKHQLKVAHLPKAIIISTGDELVGIEEQPLPHQIRRSNAYSIKTALGNWGITVDMAHLVDEEDIIYNKLNEIITNYPIIILSGGVSKGKFDFIPSVMEKLGVQKRFHKIKQRPGKPFWFGTAPNGTVIFALPGNPVSSFMCTHRYIRPWLQKSLNLPPIPPIYGVLEKEVSFRPDLTYFMQVKLSYAPNGTILATPVEGHGSGDLANLVDADAFMELPKGPNIYKAGEVHPLIPYRPFYG